MDLPSQSIVRGINLVSIRDDLVTVAAVPEVQISTLDVSSRLYQTYTRLYSNIREYYGSATPAEYRTNIIEFIKTIKKPMNIYPGTLGAFVFGCLYDTPQDGSNIFCSPNCANSVPPSNNIEVVPCSDQVWYMRDGNLSYKSGSGSNASLFGRETSLSRGEAEMLYGLGVRQVKVFSPRGLLTQTLDLPLATAVQQPTIAPIVPIPAVNAAGTEAVQASRVVSPLQAIAAAGTTGFARGPTSFLSDWKVILIIFIGIIAVGVLIYFLVKYMTAKPVEGQVPMQAIPAATPRAY